jgi:hypothetical protein
MLDAQTEPFSPDAIAKVPILVRRLYEITSELGALFGRRFTPDGHLVGSLGEVLAAYNYGIDLYVASTECHDGKCRATGRQVQVKATQGDSVALGTNEVAEVLLVLRLDPALPRLFEEVYNGPGGRVWDVAGKPQKTGQRPIRLSSLRRLMTDVPEGDRIKPVR